MGDSPLLNDLGRSRIRHSAAVRDELIQGGIYRPDRSSSTELVHFETAPGPKTISGDGNDHWRISTAPYPLSKREYRFLKTLGNQLLAFYQASNRLYFESLNGQSPAWIADLLKRGKPESVIEYGRMNRFKQNLPGVIRPDLIPTDEGMIATELDAVPGGIGLTGALSTAYAQRTGEGTELIGSGDGMVRGFERMIQSLSDRPDPLLVIVISAESEAYRPEMKWLAKALRDRGLLTFVVEPKSVSFTETGLWIDIQGEKRQVDILYRFFELFDLKNIPKSELFLYAAKKKRVILTPPPKTHLEEKSLFALFHHPQLRSFWLRHLGEETTAVLKKLFPETWVIDPAEVPPHAVIHNLTLADIPVTDFRQLGKATKKERALVIKPSGFSELAWGSRGVSVGHDLSEEDWRAVIENALAQFPETPYILQKFHKGKKIKIEYVDFEQDRLVEMEGRVRLSPYYFISGKEAHLEGVLATVCSLEKKLIHGMVDAVMAPCTAPVN